jgi:uncharacterized lipoprotein YmbA
VNTNRLATLLPIALFAFVSAGCSAATMHFYTLDSTATAGAAPAARYAVLVGPVDVPSSVDRPQFVVQVAPNRVVIDELNCWAAPLGDGIAGAIAGNLSVLLATHDVAVAPLVNFQASHRVTLSVQRFDSIPGQSVSLDALWTVTPTALTGVARSGRTIAQETVTAPGYEALAAAHSRLLAKVSGEIAAAIEASNKTGVKKKGR